MKSRKMQNKFEYRLQYLKLLHEESDLFIVRLEANWEAMLWCGRRIENYLLIRDCLFEFEPSHHIVHKNKYFEPSILFPRTHSRTSPEGYKCVRCWSTTLESWRIKRFWIREELWILVRCMDCPKRLRKFWLFVSNEVEYQKKGFKCKLFLMYIYLPSFRYSKTCIGEVSGGFPKSSLSRWC